MIRAKLFISCGQATEEERALSADICSRMTALGFDPYIAVEQQTLTGLREAIFTQLEDADYFLFVDLKRETLLSNATEYKPGTAYDSRGSLFSHQELAIASFLEIDAILFHEGGVKLRDGMLSVFQGNSIFFHNRPKLPQIVEEKVRERIQQGSWDPTHRRRLRLSVANRMCSILRTNTDGLYADFFPIQVENLHQRRSAINAYAFIERILDARTSEVLFDTPVEVKWGGTILPSVIIPPLGNRLVDGFFLHHANPSLGRFNVPWTDYGKLVPSLPKPGVFHLNYRVLSTSFPPARATFQAKIGVTLEEASFELIEAENLE